MGEAPNWQYMWGAKVKMPCDMEDDVLEDAIKHVTSRLSKFDTEEWEKNGLAVSAALMRTIPKAMVVNVVLVLLRLDWQVCEEIKAHLDDAWDPHWVVCIGRNFGSFVTHVTRNFVFFYYNEKAVMIYKAG